MIYKLAFTFTQSILKLMHSYMRKTEAEDGADK